MTRTVIIGGGIAGLATAALLAREGHEVVVLEKNSRIGGRAGTVERDGFRFDSGPSWYLMPSVFEHFFQLMGTSAQEQLDLRFLDPAYRVFSEAEPDGSWREPLTIPRGRPGVREAFRRVEPESGTRLDRYLASARRVSDLAERYFLYNTFTSVSSLLHREVLTGLPKLARLLTSSLESHAAKRFADPVLRQVLGYPAVFLGTDPAAAPAMYHLMSALDLDDGVRYPMGGFWELTERLEALALASGARIVTEAEVLCIRTDRLTDRGRSWRHGGRRSRAVGVSWRARGGGEVLEAADIVVSAADLHHTETRLLAPADRSYPERWWERRTSGPGAVIAMLGVRGELPTLPHHSLFFTRDWAANFAAIFGEHPSIPDPASIYVCKPSATDPTVAPAGHENLFVLIPVPADPGIGAGSAGGVSPSALVEHAVDAAIEQISEWAGIPDLGDRIVVRETLGPADFAGDYHSWRGGMLGPAHILSQSAMFRAQNASKRVEGLYYAGATTAPGVGVPMCLISAELVLKRIRGDNSAGPLPVPLRAEVKA
ncbi:phytoene desaturase family protein [Leucobacter soli]|uniref:4,4'-diapophytoene desaturase (4,4'-diaponeurosporene-forming) n=1 Tax=Leucobacter soli TaxID=2812850 RepID=A0A916JW64_9MICO|nr:phytoene desaturase family protein [Leucobacter soli]CAG7608402.1 4,4'-diapophytoene desaturase (4,4'-diaponeurosporene-forming) [Leucobacter soli]